MKSVLLLISLFCFFLTSCWKTENITVAQEKNENFFDKDGVSFSYPAKWKIKHDEVISGLGRVIAVQDSNESIFIISIFPSEVNLNLEGYAKDLEDGWKSKVKDGKDLEFKTSEVSRNIFLKTTEGKRLQFIFEKIPYTQDLFLVSGKKKLVTFVAQTTDKNLENVDKEFQVIFDSLKIDLEE